MNAHRIMRPKLPFLVISLFVFTLYGCTGKTITAGPILMPEYQPELASVIVVGEFQSEKLSEEQREGLSDQIMKFLKKENAYTLVLHKVPLEGKDEHIVLLDGEIVEYEEGSKFLQWFIGFGAGASELTAKFHLSTPEGQRIVAFSSERTYAGGLGIGGASFLSMQSLIEDIGEDIAVTVSEWKRGEPVGKTESVDEKASEAEY